MVTRAPALQYDDLVHDVREHAGGQQARDAPTDDDG
jgi:hypothetical protein